MKKVMPRKIIAYFFVVLMLNCSGNANDDVGITDLKEVTYYLMEDTKKQKEELKNISDLVKKNILPVTDGLDGYKIDKKLLDYINEYK